MKNKIIVILGLLGIVTNVNADIAKAKALTPEKSRKIASALNVLKDNSVLSKDKNDQFNLDTDIIQKLKAEGYLHKKHSDVQTVCGGTGGNKD